MTAMTPAKMPYDRISVDEIQRRLDLNHDVTVRVVDGTAIITSEPCQNHGYGKTKDVA